MPERYWIGAVLSLVAGAAIAAAAVLTTSGGARPAAKAVLVPPLSSQASSAQQADQAERALWRTKTVEQIFPATVALGSQYVRLGIAPAESCDVLPKDFLLILVSEAPGTSCVKVLRATYTDVTQTVFATVGVVAIGGDASARDKVWRQWTPDSASTQPDTMPDVYPVPHTAAADFADTQRITWDSQASNDGSYLVYAVSAFADGRAGSTDNELTGRYGKALVADSPPVQAASGLSDLFANEFTNAQKG